MQVLKHLLSVVAFLYVGYHIYTYGPGLFNVTVMVVFILATVANYFRHRRESELKANERARQERAQAKYDRKHKHTKTQK